jgi:hypothetical protein
MAKEACHTVHVPGHLFISLQFNRFSAMTINSICLGISRASISLLSQLNLSAYSALSLGVSLAFVYPSTAQAQAIGYGRGPNLNYFTPAVTGDSFSPSSGINCPTPTFNIGAYGGGGNDWSDNFSPTYASSSAGVNNYGVAAGLRLPLGAGELTRACKDYAKFKSEFERINTENFRRNAQISLFRQCNWLKDNHVDLFQNAFNNPVFSSLKACSLLNYVPTQGGVNRPDKISKDGPVESQVTVTTTQTLQVEGVRNIR